MKSDGEILLGIEAAIGGGSLALFRDGREIAIHVGAGGRSRAEDLLSNIFTLLSEQNLNVRQLSRIAVSTGPGSFTGIRIGIATAMGLARSVAIGFEGVSLLEAIETASPEVPLRAIAVPVGRNDIGWQVVRRDARSVMRETPMATNVDDFLTMLGTLHIKHVSAPAALISFFREMGGGRELVLHDVGDCLASLVARFDEDDTPNLTPIYLSNSSHRGIPANKP